jgi:uncharacterized protein with NAD-binding domain and iron-sulfur cluster
MNAVVVGGGYAGIAAALALADAGDHVTLLEARRHWGGRATSWPDPKMGEHVDNGQHVWLGCYDEKIALLTRLGTRDRIVPVQHAEAAHANTDGVIRYAWEGRAPGPGARAARLRRAARRRAVRARARAGRRAPARRARHGGGVARYARPAGRRAARVLGAAL